MWLFFYELTRNSYLTKNVVFFGGVVAEEGGIKNLLFSFFGCGGGGG